MTCATLNHKYYLQLALEEARKSPPKPTNFCVGALVVSPSSNLTDHILATGYTLECPGNTHAEQSCFIKLAEAKSCSVERLGDQLPEDTILYTTMEPCNKRSVGNTPCVDRILDLKRTDGSQAIRTVVTGVKEPETFVGVNFGKQKLEHAGIHVVHVPGLEDDILSVAKSGHVGGDEHKKKDSKTGVVGMNWSLSRGDTIKTRWGSGAAMTD